MHDEWRKIKPTQWTENVFRAIGEEWVLITAGNTSEFNTMTASWGTLGILWSRPVVICFVRPTRYTFNFMEKSETFSVSFFNEKHKDILNYCGTHSGRDVNKPAETGLIPEKFELQEGGEVIGFSQSRLVICCRKLYSQEMKEENFIDKSLVEDIYSKKDFHKVYVGEIDSCFTKE
ncbi:MAG: flavin reductase [Spirochaetia bacterium]